MRQLEPREKKTLLIGGITAAVIVAYVFVYAPLSEDLTRKRNAIPQRERDLAEMRLLREDYLEMQTRLQEAQAAAGRRGPLLTEIENITKRANLAGKIVSLKPQTGAQAGGVQESVVEVRLDNVTLYDIVNYTYLLERATLRVKKLAFKPRFDNPKLLNLTVLVASAG